MTSAFNRRVGVLGANSLVGSCLLPLLKKQGSEVIAFSRFPEGQREKSETVIRWLKLNRNADLTLDCEEIKDWICLIPIWHLPSYFQLLEFAGIRRIVAVSSTSRFTKQESLDAAERDVARLLVDGEQQVIDWTNSKNVSWIILRPTMIYGLGRDGNVSAIARFIRRFGFFPLLGSASGLRQPVHATDVADVCYRALCSPPAGRGYNISGGEVLTYRENEPRSCLRPHGGYPGSGFRAFQICSERGRFVEMSLVAHRGVTA